MEEIFEKRSTSLRKPTQKILVTILVLFFYRLGSLIPLDGIDQQALQNSLNQIDNKTGLIQMLRMYSSGTNSISFFSLGIIPYINASILVDLLTALIPKLEKLQSEEGEMGRRQLVFYKKLLALIFALGQSIFLMNYIQSYLYITNFWQLSFFYLLLVSGALTVIWLTNVIDNKGIGNGTSLIILLNIIVGTGTQLKLTEFNINFWLELGFLFIFLFPVCISQLARITVQVVSARQLAFLESIGNEDRLNQSENKNLLKPSGLTIKLNQAGIFPIIIASNLVPFLAYGVESVFGKAPFFVSLCYYLLIVGFNYFYTVIFWDPEKIAEQLRKASVSVINVTPGQETIAYLEQVVRGSSLAGGIFLCVLLLFYDTIKQFSQGPLLTQINISSLIIVIGVAYEAQRTLRALYKSEVN